MDPKAALIACDQAISDCDTDEAWLILGDYWHWRHRGGFEPEVYGQRGDAFARECQRRIESQQLQQGVTR